MKTSRAIRHAENTARKTNEYQAGALKLNFALALDARRELCGLTRAEMARCLGTSLAYVSEVLRGESNLTLATMTKLARALNGQVRIEIVGEEDTC